MAQGLGADLWPSELETQQLLLGALSRDGKLGIEKESLHLLLSSILCLSDAKSHIGAREVTRRFSSAAIAVALFNAAQERELNHYALLESWVQYVAYGIGMALRNGCGYRHISCSIDLAKAQIYSALVALAEEAGERPNLLQGNMLTDIFVQRARCTLMAGLMSVYWFWSEREGWPDGMSRRTSVMRLLDNIESRLYLWGEGAIPQLLLYYWYMRETRPHASVDRLLYLLLASLAVKGRAGEVQGVPGPYWTYEDICRHEMAGFLGLYDDPLKREFHGGTTFYGEGLLSLLARTGRKEACRNVYPALTERMSGYVLPGAKWRFVLWRDEKARRISYAFDQPKKWSVLVEQAQRISCDHVPSALSRDRELFALFLLIFPWRASPDVLRALAWKYDKTWFLPGSPPR